MLDFFLTFSYDYFVYKWLQLKCEQSLMGWGKITDCTDVSGKLGGGAKERGGGQHCREWGCVECTVVTERLGEEKHMHFHIALCIVEQS